MKRFYLILVSVLIFVAPLFSAVNLAYAAEVNLVKNPSVETARPANPNLPQYWKKIKTGTNTAKFTYIKTEGHTGTHSIKAQITSYTDGDAKWFFDYVVVEPGKTYKFSDYYKSSVETEIVLQVLNTSGVVSLYPLGKATASQVEWSNYMVDFTTPSDAKKVSVIHLINKVGWLQTDDAYLALAETTTPVAPTVSITNPDPGATVSGVQTITADAASTGASVAGVQFMVDGVNIGGEDTTAPYEAQWDTASYANATHNLTAVARSTNGFSATSNIVQVTVNNIAPLVDENIIPNPSVETVDSINAQEPAFWNNNKWGTNTAVFTYESNGYTGSRSVTTTVTSITNGDAKWYFEPVDVVAGKNYVYQDYYKSNVPTRVVVAYIDAGGNYSYVELAGAPIATDWKLYNTSFIVPTTAVKATVFHLVDSVGTLTIDDAYMQVGVTPPPSLVIPNGSVELGDTSPTGWQTNSWGVNLANFQWVNEGHIGNKSIKTTVTNYVDGDAKWFFTPISTLTVGNQYRFNAWYKTNVIPKAVALYIKSDGTEQYVGMPNPQPSGNETEWQQYSDVFTVPENTVAVSVFLFVNENGWLQTDDYTISDYSPNGFSRPLLSLTFDDGEEINTSTALPIMNQYGFKSTQCFATTFIENDATGQNTNNVLAFYNSGHEVCSHSVTHPFLTSLNDADLNYELQHSKQFLESIIGSPVVNFASPYGDYNQHVNSVIDDYYQSHRTVDEGFNSKDNFDIYRLRVQNVLNTTTAAQISAWVEQAKSDKTWLILLYHRVANDPGLYDTSIDMFTSHIEVIGNSGITVKTWNDALTEVKSQI